MNIVAAGIAWVMFRQVGYLRWRLLVPFVAASVPFALIGGLAPIGGRAQTLVLGFALLLGGLRLLLVARPPSLGVRAAVCGSTWSPWLPEPSSAS